MAAPNLKNPTTITGKTAAYSIGAAATKQGIVTCGSSSNTVLKINSILCANDDSAVAADVTAQHRLRTHRLKQPDRRGHRSS